MYQTLSFFLKMYSELYHENKTKEYKIAQLEEEILDLKRFIIRDEYDKTTDKIEY